MYVTASGWTLTRTGLANKMHRNVMTVLVMYPAWQHFPYELTIVGVEPTKPMIFPEVRSCATHPDECRD